MEIIQDICTLQEYFQFPNQGIVDQAAVTLNDTSCHLFTASTMDDDNVATTLEASSRPLTAFQHFMQWCDQQIRNSEQMEVVYNPPLVEQCSKHWNEIPAEGKVHFENLAALDEERCRVEVDVQSVAPCSPPVVAVEATESKTKRRKRSMDPDFPKRACWPIEFFTRDQRSKIKDEYKVQGKSLSKTEMAKVLSERWAAFKMLPEAEHYKSLAEMDKLRYRNEMEEYKRRKAVEQSPK